MKKFFNLITIFLITGILIANNITYGEELNDLSFLTEYDLEYNVGEDGETKVIQTITITNLKDSDIATSYSITINQKELYGIEGYSKDKKITVAENKNNDNSTTLIANFPDYVVGEGRQNTVTISYKSKDIATKFGEIWNINIPKTDLNETITRYNVNLNLPKSFGPKIFITPDPDTQTEEEKITKYGFTKEKLKGRGINASFGDYQLVNFRLKYQLENASLLSSNYEVAFPPEIKGVQQIKYENISPKPKYIYIDRDGNSIGVFKVKGKDKLDIEIVGKGRIVGRQINPSLGGDFSDIPKETFQDYTTEQKYWETDSPTIKAIAEKLYDPNENVAQNAQNIYDYVVNSLEYDFESAEKGYVARKGANEVLNSSMKDTCMGFTDSFITLARSLGIPAREINGYAFTNEDTNKPISITYESGARLHSWAEFYDPNLGWVQIDPTWGKTSGVDYFTKLDTNHFAFAIKGISSESPIPAGAYVVDDYNDQIEIVFSQEKTKHEFDYQLDVSKVFNWNLIKYIQGFSKYKVENKGTTFVYDTKGNPIPPGQSFNIYIERDKKTYEFMDFYNKSIEINIE